MKRDNPHRQGGQGGRRRRTEAKARVRKRSLRKERPGATREAARAAGVGIAPALRPPETRVQTPAETRVQTPKAVPKLPRTRRLRLEDALTRRRMLELKSAPRPAWLKMRCPSPSCAEPHHPCLLPPAACRTLRLLWPLSLAHLLTHPLNVTSLPTKDGRQACEMQGSRVQIEGSGPCAPVFGRCRVDSAHFPIPDRIRARHGCTRARALEMQAMKAANMSGPVLVGLQDELDKVKAAAKTGTTALVKHIIKAHPPKSNQEVQLDFSEAGASYDHVCVCCVGA